MRRTVTTAGLFVSVIVAAALSTAPAQAQPHVAVTAVTGSAADVIAGEYIVMTRPGAARSVSRARGQAMYVYEDALHGFAARLTDKELAELQRDPNVVSIEHNQRVRAMSVQSPTPNWGVDRIDQRTLPLNNSYTYFNTGQTVTAYIIDTGINPTHPDFGGRAAVAVDLIGGNGIDCNGHGTHVAGTIGSATYGVAKRVQLRGVRALDCAGSGSFATVVAAVNWVHANSPGPSVALMALGGPTNAALNAAVGTLTSGGVFLGVSAGSSAVNACNISPAGAPGAYAVVRSTSTDQSPSTNNWGPCVKIHAPGTGIPSTWLGTGTNTISGTSMAAAHVVGVAAMFKHAVGDVPTGVLHSWLTGVATGGVLTGVHPQTPNLLLYTNQI
jgi:subtilisin family serine protease